MSESINTPGSSPTEPLRDIEPEIITPQTSPNVVGGGLGDEKQPKPFNLPEKGAGGVSQEQISPMELAQTQQQKINPQEISQRINYMNNKFGQIGTMLQNNPNATIPKDRVGELNNTMGGLGEDLRHIAQLTGGKYSPPQESNNIMEWIKNFVSGGQAQFDQALQSLGKMKNPNPAEMLRLSYTVQRATQKTELFSSIISSTVGGIKTIMGTQLG